MDLGRAIDEPFPLRRRFRRRILPGLLAFVALLLGLLVAAIDRVVDGIYLELARERGAEIAREVERAAPEAWRNLLAGRTSDADLGALRGVFAEAVGDGRVVNLNVYDLTGVTIFSTKPGNVGKREDGAALRGVLTDGSPGLVDHREDDGSRYYELYIPITDSDGRLRTVFELYEPTTFLDALLAASLVPPIVVPGLMLAGLVVVLARLVGRAQADIDARTAALVALRERLARFVSDGAAGAARAAGEAAITSRRLEVCLLHTDVRGFTAFAEANPPEDVVAFLNRLMAIQVAAVRRHGGDVDKMIGDALLAVFTGEGRQARAIAAARELLRSVEAAALPRGVGVGLFDGPVVVGAVGPAERQDFTVIGDSVNTVARLCDAAGAGELVVEAATLAGAGLTGGIPESLVVKGKAAPLGAVRLGTADFDRLRIDGAAAHATGGP